MQVGNSKVKKILMGDKVVYRDSDGWIPLELPDGVNGLVFFKDNEDGTASLSGNAGFTVAKHAYSEDGFSIQKHDILLPPVGYYFSGGNWASGADHRFPDPSVTVMTNNGNNAPVSRGVSGALSFTDGKIVFEKLFDNTSTTVSKVVVSFFKDAGIPSKNSVLTDFATPMIVGIAKA